MLTLAYVVVALILTSGLTCLPYMEEEINLETQLDRIDNLGRSKRINEMACHCCSNSFNSNCCYKCMRSFGKRAETVSMSENQLEREEIPKQVLDSDIIDKGMSELEDYCLCCVLEDETESSLSPCCSLCTQDIHTERSLL